MKTVEEIEERIDAVLQGLDESGNSFGRKSRLQAQVRALYWVLDRDIKDKFLWSKDG